MAIRSGKLRHRVTVQNRSTVQDATGAPVREWADFATRWASVEPLTGREFFLSQQRGARVQTRFRFRFLEGLEPRMRLVWQGRVFNITDVQRVNGIKYEMLVMADELVEVPL